jgi:hypothetical protein
VNLPVIADGTADIWQVLETELGMTLAGRIMCVLVMVVVGGLGVAGVVADAVFGGVQGDQEGAVLGVFVALALAVSLGVVFGLDAAFRGVRAGVRGLGRQGRGV